MAVRGTAQIDLVDLTDGYSVVMSNEAVTLVGGPTYANEAVVRSTAYAFCGARQTPCSIDASRVVVSGDHGSGIAASVDSDPTSPTLTLAVTAGRVFGRCEVSVPVAVPEAGIVVEKSVSVSVARTGTRGPEGADAVTLAVTSSEGFAFKDASTATTLVAHVFRGGREVPSAEVDLLGLVRWYRDGAERAVASGTSLRLPAGAVGDRVSFVAQLEV